MLIQASHCSVWCLGISIESRIICTQGENFNCRTCLLDISEVVDKTLECHEVNGNYPSALSFFEIYVFFCHFRVWTIFENESVENVYVKLLKGKNSELVTVLSTQSGQLLVFFILLLQVKIILTCMCLKWKEKKREHHEGTKGK